MNTPRKIVFNKRAASVILEGVTEELLEKIMNSLNRIINRARDKRIAWDGLYGKEFHLIHDKWTLMRVSLKGFDKDKTRKLMDTRQDEIIIAETVFCCLRGRIIKKVTINSNNIK